MNVSTLLPIRWKQLFKFHISFAVSILDAFYLFSNVFFFLLALQPIVGLYFAAL
jgi:hypothetical protein